MTWTIEKRKQGNEIWVSSNVKPESILVGEGYEKKEYKRSMELAKVVVEALNQHEAREITIKHSKKVIDTHEDIYGESDNYEQLDKQGKVIAKFNDIK
jgi:hypothetical protein